MYESIFVNHKNTACGVMPKRNGADFDWRELHRQHVMRLRSAWDLLLTHSGFKTVVIHSGVAALKYSRDDQHWPMETTPHFKHWLPYEETPAILMITKGETPQLFRAAHASYWDSPGQESKCWDRDSFAISEVKQLSEIRVPSSTAFIGDDLGLAAALGINPDDCNAATLLDGADYIRTLKSDFEVACIWVANEIAARGHLAVKDLFYSGQVSELELHYAYLASTAQTDFTVPYGNIVAIGQNCGVLHHVNYRNERFSGDTSLLLDAGAKLNGYAADVTRTWVRGGGGEAELFRKIIFGVDEAQKKLVSQLLVGKPYEELHNFAHFLLADVLISVGLINCSREIAVAKGITRIFFPHGLGHSLGIQVHDVGMRLSKPATNNKYLRNTSVITEGQVVTVEPGLYFIPMLLKEAFNGELAQWLDREKIDMLMQYGGVRIEDNILATKNGPVNLSVNSPRLGG